MTTLAEEAAEQKRWIAQAHDKLDAYHALLANEFDTPESHRERVAVPLTRILRIAAQHVPHYRALFQSQGLNPALQDPFEVLGRMPLLSKNDVHAAGDRLVAEAFPEARDRIASVTQSSGTTGRPTRIQHSLASTRIFGVLKQREYRWFRFDPAETLASIRLPGQLPRRDDGGVLANGEVLRQPAWPYMSGLFDTGQHFCFNVTNPVERQLDFLRKLRPRYLLAYPESLEHMAFAAAPDWPAEPLKSVLAMSEQLTPGMRRHIARSFGVAVHQNYGLNEIGLVAVRCAAGRYHVHTENCLVEILDDAGKPVEPGAAGRLIVTALMNTAMPLLRYDSGDLAVACDAVCPCGRTMPAFGDVVGRYSRIAFLPPGTLERIGALRSAIEDMPAEAAHGLRQIQVHQYRDGRFELRVVGKTGSTFADAVRKAWPPGAQLTAIEVTEIPRPSGGKFQVFTSDFMPAFVGGDEADDDTLSSGR